MIYVTGTTGDWWVGTLADQSKSGTFPATYVKKLDIQVFMHVCMYMFKRVQSY